MPTWIVPPAQKQRFSQHNVDVLDCRENRYREISLRELLPDLPLWYKKIVLEHDHEEEMALRDRGIYENVWFVSLQRVLENRMFTGLMQSILKTLERVYGTPVDIEYTVNMDENEEFVVNLLQCRPLYQGRKGDAGSAQIPEISEAFFELQSASMGSSRKRKVDVVVQIDPAKYNEYPYARKYEVAAAVGNINRYYRDSGKNMLLMAPGRIGTSSPELGIPTQFADISCFSEICEISDSRAGFMPELSYGSHMFQDMVEAEISYSAIWNDRRTLRYDPGLLDSEKNLFPEIAPDCPGLWDMITVREPECLYFWLDSVRNYVLCGRCRLP